MSVQLSDFSLPQEDRGLFSIVQNVSNATFKAAIETAILEASEDQ